MQLDEQDPRLNRGVQIATILVDAWKKEIEQSSAVKVEQPCFARRSFRGTIGLFLRKGDQFLFQAIDHKCHDITQKILDLVDQPGLKTLLTSNVGRTVLHNAPKCKVTTEDFLKQLVKRYPELMKQTDDDGLDGERRVMGIPIIQCILNKDEFSLNVRKSFATLLFQKTDVKSRNPLHVAAAAGANGVSEHIVRFLLEAIIPEQSLYFYPSAIEDKDIEGNVAMDIALKSKLIIERWPELINEQDENGKTPLERAQKQEQIGF
ncbi:hypothetical protein Cgig2_000247 [Carnegiea gigantea]|uniref:Uncharacterized protein n=1 Tax=Carnegiea gigantea TaxID=171969 RepID=A0A9Q1GMB2_9CARY|nr:hypothetical protein Cgig2_000247 [Carnegiea gigantea]